VTAKTMTNDDSKPVTREDALDLLDEVKWKLSFIEEAAENGLIAGNRGVGLTTAGESGLTLIIADVIADITKARNTLE